jgi:cystathionine gamma-synthase
VNRLFINHIVQKLNARVLALYDYHGHACLSFPTAKSAERCFQYLQREWPSEHLRIVSFALAGKSLFNGWSLQDRKWAHFYAVVYPQQLSDGALAFWRQSGDGISSRQAELCLQTIDFSKSESFSPLKSIPQMPGLCPLPGSDAKEQMEIRSFIAKIAAPDGSPPILVEDVFLFPKGLAAIYAVSRALKATNLGSEPETVVIYG